MGRRRKRRVKQKKFIKRPANYFQCPRCQSQTLTIQLKRSENPGMKVAIARCGTCGLYCVIEVPDAYDKIDVYNMISDYAYEDRLDECSGEAEELDVEGESPGLAEEGEEQV